MGGLLDSPMTRTGCVHQSTLLGVGQGRVYSHRDRHTQTLPALGKTPLALAPYPFLGLCDFSYICSPNSKPKERCLKG